MSSIKREYALPVSAILDVPVTSGDGSNNESEAAKVYIDPRKSSVFRVDISNLDGNGEQSRIYVKLNTFDGAPGAVPGKEITVLFSGNPNYNNVYVYFTDKFGENATNMSVYLDGNTDGVPTAVKLMSNGTDFVVLTRTRNDD